MNPLLNEQEQYFKIRLANNDERNSVWKEIVDYLLPYLKGDILDIGCGHGNFLMYAPGNNNVGMDLELSEKFPKDIAFVWNDAVRHREEFNDKFDTVLISNFLEHLSSADVRRVLRNAKDYLRKGGRLIIIQPNYKYAYREYWDDYTHRTAFTHVSMKELLQSLGYAIERVTPKFLPYSINSRIPVNRNLIRAYLYSPIKPFAGQMLIIARKEA